MNTRKVDKTKKSNIKCEHCEAWDKDSGWCCIQGKEKNYWNRCKDFIWNHKYQGGVMERLTLTEEELRRAII